jgi:hypothetical protein
MHHPLELVGGMAGRHARRQFADARIQRALKAQVGAHVADAAHELRAAQQGNKGAEHRLARPGDDGVGGFALRRRHGIAGWQRHPLFGGGEKALGRVGGAGVLAVLMVFPVGLWKAGPMSVSKRCGGCAAGKKKATLRWP